MIINSVDAVCLLVKFTRLLYCVLDAILLVVRLLLGFMFVC